MLQNGNHPPDLLTSLMNMSLVYKCQGQCIFPDPLQMSHAIVLGNATKPSRSAHFWQGAQSLPLATQNDIWTSKSAPYPSVFCTVDLDMCFAPQLRALFRHVNFQKWSENRVFARFDLEDLETCSAPQRRALFWHLNFQKWSDVVSFYILNRKCASRHNCVHFFDMATSKSGPRMVCFVRFDLEDLEMCFAPQRHALFWHLKFPKCSENGVLCTLWLRNVLHTTTVCIFSTCQLPKLVRRWCALYILTWKCASRHSGVHFFDISTSKSAPRALCFLTSTCASHHNGVHFFDISTSKSGLKLVGFVHFDLEICFGPQRRSIFSLIRPDGSAPAAWVSLLLDLPEPQIIGKNTVNRDFSTFSRTCIFFLLTPSLLWSSLFFSSFLLFSSPLLFSDSSHLSFSSVHIVGSLTSKLPSIIPY